LKAQDFRKEFLGNLPFTYDEQMSTEEINYSYTKIDEFYQKLKVIEKEAHDYNQLEKLFELEKSGYK
jgi:dynein heavy chain